MHIYFDSPQQFKVELDKNDLSELDITYQQMDYGDSHTREVLQGLLKRIGLPGGFDALSGRVLIEVFPRSNDGCMVQFTSIEAHAQTPTVRMRKARFDAAVYEFSSADDMLDAVKALRGKNPQVEIYLCDGKYRAVNYFDREEKKAVHVLDEFATLIAKGSTAAAYTAEHGQAIDQAALFGG